MTTMNDYRFYDTCSLLLKVDELCQNPEHIVISTITLEELEEIKTSSRKDADVKYAARKLTRWIDEHPALCTVHIFTNAMLKPMIDMDLEINNDIKILATAFDFDNNVHPDGVTFFTNDLALKNIANLFFGDGCIKSVSELDFDDYTGYLEIYPTDTELEMLYTDITDNIFDALPGQYVILRNAGDEIIDRLCWTGERYRNFSFKPFTSQEFGIIKPIDVNQQMVADSFINNKITMVKGKAGTGKSLLSLGFLFNKMEHGEIDKIVIFCNTVATKGAAKLGYYPGTRDEKLLDSQIGNMLASKLGDKLEVQRLIDANKLELLPLSDVRGYDTTGMNAGIYITEAQNTDVALMKLALQRIGDDCIAIIDGDYDQQVDDVAFAGANNGMRRVSQVFRGEKIYGEVKLTEIHRSEIGRIADKM